MIATTSSLPICSHQLEWISRKRKTKRKAYESVVPRSLEVCFYHKMKTMERHCRTKKVLKRQNFSKTPLQMTTVLVKTLKLHCLMRLQMHTWPWLLEDERTSGILTASWLQASLVPQQPTSLLIDARMRVVPSKCVAPVYLYSGDLTATDCSLGVLFLSSNSMLSCMDKGEEMLKTFVSETMKS